MAKKRQVFHRENELHSDKHSYLPKENPGANILYLHPLKECTCLMNQKTPPKKKHRKTNAARTVNRNHLRPPWKTNQRNERRLTPRCAFWLVHSGIELMSWLFAIACRDKKTPGFLKLHRWPQKKNKSWL